MLFESGYFLSEVAKALQHLRHAEVTVARIGGGGEGRLLAQGALDFVGAYGGGALAFGSEAAAGGFDVRCVELVELFDVGDDLGDLCPEGFEFFFAKFEVRELRDFRNVSFGYRHVRFGCCLVENQ
jgi:hypothetical protein